MPHSVDEEIKAPLVPVQPSGCFLRILRRRTIFHADEFFCDAHRTKVDLVGVSMSRTLCDGMTILCGVSSGDMVLQLTFNIPYKSTGPEAEQLSVHPGQAEFLLHHRKPVDRLLGGSDSTSW